MVPPVAAALETVVSPKKFVAVTLTEYVPFVPTVVSFEPAVRSVTVGVPGAARFEDEPAIIWYSSPSIIS